MVSCKLTKGRVGVLALCKRLHCFSCAVLYVSVGKLERYYGNPGYSQLREGHHGIRKIKIALFVI